MTSFMRNYNPFEKEVIYKIDIQRYLRESLNELLKYMYITLHFYNAAYKIVYDDINVFDLQNIKWRRRSLISLLKIRHPLAGYFKSD